MRIIRQPFQLPAINYPIEYLAPLDKILFFDIETTGFSAKNATLYLIGCAYYDSGSWNMIQWFASDYEEEGVLIRAFFDFARPYTHLVHFNGSNFDIPFLSQKCQQYEIPDEFDHFEGIDLYKRVSPYKFILKMPSFKQKSVEQFLGICRDDALSGGELINVYHDYVASPDVESLGKLLLHNSDDIKGLIRILPILSYYDLFNRSLKAKKVQANTYQDFFGSEHKELLIRCSLPSDLPIKVKAHANSCYFSGEGKVGHLRIPMYEEEMKYFYANYKDYYYLPDEDVAVHKSVSSFVDKQYRMPAKAENCYTRKYSSYLPEWDLLVQPFFKRDYKSKELFFELSESMKTDRDFFSRYSEHVLHMIAYSF